MADLTYIEDRYWRYWNKKLLVDTDTDTEISNHNSNYPSQLTDLAQYKWKQKKSQLEWQMGPDNPMSIQPEFSGLDP